MIVLLSPSKTQDFEASNRNLPSTQSDFIRDTKELLPILQDKSAEEMSQLMNISERLGFLAHNYFQDIQFPFDAEDDRQAIVAFKGDVYEGLDVDTLSDEDIDFAQTHLRIISGFYGILRPLDLIQPYRLEMKTPLKTPRGKNLYEFWGNFLIDYVRTRYAHQNIINLASQEYAKAVLNPSVKGVITPVFKDYKKDKLRVVAIYAKKARGKMARYIIKNRIKSPEDIKKFADDGYKYSSEHSSKEEWVFVRGK